MTPPAVPPRSTLTRFRSRAHRRFWKCYSGLPPNIREQARLAFQFFQADPGHPSLNFKRLNGVRHPFYSVRIGSGYRALCLMEGETLLWFFIGTHDDYERVIGGLA